MSVRFDAVRLTALSESNARDMPIDTLQIHHATTTSLSGLESLMAPGGRTVSANGALGNDGTLVLKVGLNRRAFTSATNIDERSFTVECCNTTLAPNWRISDASHERLAVLLLDLHDTYGVPLKRGMPGVIGHNEVPGTYPTACPGPSMDLDRIVRRAIELKEERDMPDLDDIRAVVRAELKAALQAENLILTERAQATNPKAAAVTVQARELWSADHARLFRTEQRLAAIEAKLNTPAPTPEGNNPA